MLTCRSNSYRISASVSFVSQRDRPQSVRYFQHFVSLMVPTIAFTFERVEHTREANFFQHGDDFSVFGLAVGRVVGDVGLQSAFQLALLRSKSRIVQFSAPLVLIQILYLKYLTL